MFSCVRPQAGQVKRSATGIELRFLDGGGMKLERLRLEAVGTRFAGHRKARSGRKSTQRRRA